MDDLCLRRGDGTMEEIRGARMVTFEGDEANDVGSWRIFIYEIIKIKHFSKVYNFQASKFAGNSSKSDETGAIGDGSGQPSMDNSNGIVEVPGQMTNGNGDPDSEFDDVIEEEEEQEEDLFNMDGKETDPLILTEKKKKKGGKKVDASWKIKPPNRVPDPETLAALKKLEEGGLHG
jgi:hypothetical protein